MIKDLYEEISALNKSDNKQLAERFVKFNEEFGEFSAEVAKLIGITHKPYDREHLIEEMADTLQNLLSLFANIREIDGIELEEVLSVMATKNEKWRSKIPEYTRNKEIKDGRNNSST